MSIGIAPLPLNEQSRLQKYVFEALAAAITTHYHFDYDEEEEDINLINLIENYDRVQRESSEESLGPSSLYKVCNDYLQTTLEIDLPP